MACREALRRRTVWTGSLLTARGPASRGRAFGPGGFGGGVAGEDGVPARFQGDDEAAVAEGGAVGGVEPEAAAGGDDGVGEGGGLGGGFAFERAEGRLAVVGEDVGHIAPGGAFDEVVGVDGRSSRGGGRGRGRRRTCRWR